MLKRLLTFIVICVSSVAVAQNQEREANLKAAFVYNFTRYIEWDKDFSTSYFTIGIIGPGSIIRPFEQVAQAKTVGGKKIHIHLFNKPEDIIPTNILFITAGSTFPLRSILDKVERGTVTISEQNGYARAGTAFNFVQNGDKLKFEVNLKAIYLAGVKVSSQLLKLATIVD